MHDGDDTMNHESSLAAALRALPQASPESDPWPQLARALNRRRRSARWRRALPLALAAGVAIAIVLPRWPFESRPATAPTALSTAGASVESAASGERRGDDRSELEALHRRSQSLESWIAAFSANAPQDSRDLMAAVEVEDLIGLVDVQLDGARGDADALPLWRRRVALLQDLATIRGNAFAVAANDAGFAHAASNLLN